MQSALMPECFYHDKITKLSPGNMLLPLTDLVCIHGYEKHSDQSNVRNHCHCATSLTLFVAFLLLFLLSGFGFATHLLYR